MSALRIDKTKAFIENPFELESEKKKKKWKKGKKITSFDTIPRFLTSVITFTPTISNIYFFWTVLVLANF